MIAIHYITIYLIAGMGLLSLIWIYQSIKTLTEGLVRNLFRYIFAIAGYAFAYAVWIFCISVEIIKIDIVLCKTLDSVFIVIFFVIITKMAVTVKKIGNLYGFKSND